LVRIPPFAADFCNKIGHRRRRGRSDNVKDFLGISATALADTSQAWADSMVESDILSLKIRELMDWQTVAWRRVADPLVTAFERREIRNHMRESDAELRRYLGMMSDRLRFQARAAEQVGDSLANLKFRLLLA
jgi:hypothetical protein